jgi:hypothetical protein
LLPRRASCLRGPKILSPQDRNRSTIPETRGTSGPHGQVDFGRLRERSRLSVSDAPTAIALPSAEIRHSRATKITGRLVRTRWPCQRVLPPSRSDNENLHADSQSERLRRPVDITIRVPHPTNWEHLRPGQPPHARGRPAAFQPPQRVIPPTND